MGYKVWCINFSNGYLYSFTIYQGKGSQNEHTKEFGLGASIVLDLVQRLPEGSYHLLADNYFMSIPLLKRMKELEYGCTGTFKRNMLQNCPLTEKRPFMKEARGTIEAFYDPKTQVLMCQWMDNSAVVVGSNCEGVWPTDKAKRYNGTKKEYFEVDRPHMITDYNSGMGGTDVMDQALSCYHPSIRNRKWYFPIFVFLLKVGSFNAWMLHKQLTAAGKQTTLPYLDFIRSIVRDYLSRHGTERKIGRRANVLRVTKVSKRVEDSIRYDGKDHLMDIAPTKSRGALCGMTVKRYCTKCKVKLHDRCFAAFHGMRG